MSTDTLIRKFDPERVRPLPGQPRKRFAGIAELAESIREIGQIAPGAVTLVKGDDQFDAQLIDGERRLRACRQAGVKFRAEVHDGKDDEELFALSLAANFGKQNHDPIEIAEGLGRLRKAGKTLEQMARIMGHSIAWCYTYLSLLELDKETQALLIPGGNGKPLLTMSHAGELLRLPERLRGPMVERIRKGGGMPKNELQKKVSSRLSRAGLMTANGRTMARLNSLTSTMQVNLGYYADLPASELHGVVDRADGYHRRTAIEQLEDIAETAGLLAKAIAKRSEFSKGTK
jgi:ParB/RepB/Spo0J family partition protein